MDSGALHPGALSLSNRIKGFNTSIIKGRGSPMWITLVLHVLAYSIYPDHLKTHRITLGSRTDHASDQVPCFLSKAIADHISSLYIAVTHALSWHCVCSNLAAHCASSRRMVSLLYANGVNGEDLATLTEDILCEGTPYDSLCCPHKTQGASPCAPGLFIPGLFPFITGSKVSIL